MRMTSNLSGKQIDWIKSTSQPGPLIQVRTLYCIMPAFFSQFNFYTLNIEVITRVIRVIHRSILLVITLELPKIKHNPPLLLDHIKLIMVLSEWKPDLQCHALAGLMATNKINRIIDTISQNHPQKTSKYNWKTKQTLLCDVTELPLMHPLNQKLKTHFAISNYLTFAICIPIN